MGGRMTSNKGLNYFNPDVTLLNTTRAVVAYTSLTSGGTAQIIVDCSEDVVLDRSSREVYVAERFESSRRNENNNENNNDNEVYVEEIKDEVINKDNDTE